MIDTGLESRRTCGMHGKYNYRASYAIFLIHSSSDADAEQIIDAHACTYAACEAGRDLGETSCIAYALAE